MKRMFVRVHSEPHTLYIVPFREICAWPSPWRLYTHLTPAMHLPCLPTQTVFFLQFVVRCRLSRLMPNRAGSRLSSALGVEDQGDNKTTSISRNSNHKIPKRPTRINPRLRQRSISEPFLRRFEIVACMIALPYLLQFQWRNQQPVQSIQQKDH